MFHLQSVLEVFTRQTIIASDGLAQGSYILELDSKQRPFCYKPPSTPLHHHNPTPRQMPLRTSSSSITSSPSGIGHLCWRRLTHASCKCPVYHLAPIDSISPSIIHLY